MARTFNEILKDYLFEVSRAISLQNPFTREDIEIMIRELKSIDLTLIALDYIFTHHSSVDYAISKVKREANKILKKVSYGFSSEETAISLINYLNERKADEMRKERQ